MSHAQARPTFVPPAAGLSLSGDRRSCARSFPSPLRDAARANLDAIKAQIAAQRASVTRAEKSLQQAQANNSQEQVQLDFYRVTAPFAGVVGDIPVKVGDYVTPSSLLLSLTENNALELNIAVPMEQANRLRIGLPVQLLDPTGMLLATSKIFFVSPTVNTQSQSILVKAKFDNPQGQLRADQLLRARIVWQQQPGFLIPTSAVARVAGLDFVYVAHPGKEKKLVAQQREVKLGEIQGNDYQVLGGLKPQEQVVVSGILKLADGTPIVVEQ
jgi:RND family efflux transporter MFP subunit